MIKEPTEAELPQDGNAPDIEEILQGIFFRLGSITKHLYGIKASMHRVDGRLDHMENTLTAILDAVTRSNKDSEK